MTKRAFFVKLKWVQNKIMMERRKFIRLETTIKVDYKSEEAKTSGSGLCRNISLGGIRLISNKRLEKDQAMELKMYIIKKQKPVTATGRIMWVKEIAIKGSTNVYDIGIKFLHIEKEDEKIFFEYIFDLIQKAL